MRDRGGIGHRREQEHGDRWIVLFGGLGGESAPIEEGVLGPGPRPTGRRHTRIATGAVVFNGARVGVGAEVEFHAVVHVNTVVPAGTAVPMGWFAGGDPAELVPPGRSRRGRPPAPRPGQVGRK